MRRDMSVMKQTDRRAVRTDEGEHQRRPRRDRLRRAVVGVVVGVGLVAAGATAANAARVGVGGGVWDYGVTSFTASTNWSNYHHSSRVHGSSVTGDAGLVRSACRGGGYWAYAKAWDSNPFRIDKAYWRHC
jgi:lactococcin 972 family bacteriocin